VEQIQAAPAVLVPQIPSEWETAAAVGEIVTAVRLALVALVAIRAAAAGEEDAPIAVQAVREVLVAVARFAYIRGSLATNNHSDCVILITPQP